MTGRLVAMIHERLKRWLPELRLGGGLFGSGILLRSTSCIHAVVGNAVNPCLLFMNHAV